MFKISNKFDVEPLGPAMEFLPRFWLNGITVSPQTDAKTRERLLAETFGSMDWLWSDDDEIRFMNETRQLVSFVLTAPEESVDVSWDLRPLLKAPCSTSGLVASRLENFGFEPMDARWVSEDGKHIVCVRQSHLSRGGSYRRIQVAQDVDFVFNARVLCAWTLHNPARYIVEKQEVPEDIPLPPGMDGALRNYLSLFEEPNIGAMQDGDPGLLCQLERLLSELNEVPRDPRRDVLISRTRFFCEEWYGARGD